METYWFSTNRGKSADYWLFLHLSLHLWGGLQDSLSVWHGFYRRLPVAVLSVRESKHANEDITVIDSIQQQPSVCVCFVKSSRKDIEPGLDWCIELMMALIQNQICKRCSWLEHISSVLCWCYICCLMGLPQYTVFKVYHGMNIDIVACTFDYYSCCFMSLKVPEFFWCGLSNKEQKYWFSKTSSRPVKNSPSYRLDTPDACAAWVVLLTC